MKKAALLLIILTVVIGTLTGCAKASSDSVSDSISDDSRMKVLNVRYKINDFSISDMKVICDSKTGLLYLTGLGSDGGFTPFNYLETNHDGDVVVKQYTLDMFQKEYQQTQSTKIRLK